MASQEVILLAAMPDQAEVFEWGVLFDPTDEARITETSDTTLESHRGYVFARNAEEAQFAVFMFGREQLGEIEPDAVGAWCKRSAWRACEMPFFLADEDLAAAWAIDMDAIRSTLGEDDAA